MKLKTRIYLLQLVIAAIVLMMATVAYVSIRSAHYNLKRVQAASHQLDAIRSVNVHANRFSEQIAELLLIGEAERADYLSAGRDLEAGFSGLEKTTLDESALLSTSGEASDSRDELRRVQRMRVLHARIDRSVSKLFSLRNQGRNEDAVQLFRVEIENRLDAEMEQLLRAALLDEQNEVKQVAREADARWLRLASIVAIATVFAIAICLATAYGLARALIPPVAKLIAGADAISRGELDHRIAYRSNDELGLLAQSFNQMGEQLEGQHTQVKDAQAGLEHEVAERTGELATANHRLSTLDRLRVQFLADISHELRTPLTALRGEAEITLRHAPKPETAYRDALERIVMLARDMSRLVDDLLFLARSEADTLRFDLRRLALHDLAFKVCREGEALGHGKGIAVQIEFPDEPIWIIADAQRLKQAFLIVLDNAIKYSPCGSVVRMQVVAMNDFAEITVRDQGKGISAEELPFVLDRFYRGNAPGGPGTGLGLAIAKWLVEKHGGEIAVTSKADSFTEVKIRIPRLEHGQ